MSLTSGATQDSNLIATRRLMGKSPLYGLATATALTALLTAGCSLQDSICGGTEYAVKPVGSAQGGSCVAEGKEPPAGYVRYPEGKVPKHVDDEWDVYWADRILDSEGKEVKG